MSVVERVISVQYRHQLHFTDRVFAPENPVLASLPTGGPSEASATPRGQESAVMVLPVLEEALAAARPGLPPEHDALFRPSPARLRPAGGCCRAPRPPACLAGVGPAGPGSVRAGVRSDPRGTRSAHKSTDCLPLGSAVRHPEAVWHRGVVAGAAAAAAAAAAARDM